LPTENGSLTLNFDPTTASGNSGCNTFNGPYQLRDNSLTIGPLASTQVACADQAISNQEASYLDALQQVIRYEIRGNELILFNAAGANLLHFALVAGTPN
jgi:putative lipoprotein